MIDVLAMARSYSLSARPGAIIFRNLPRRAGN